MKTTMITLTAFFALFANVLFAGNDYIRTNPVVNGVTVVLLAPVPPAEATFEDTAPVADISLLAPAVPSEAGFEELNGDATDSLDFTSSLPTEADFE